VRRPAVELRSFAAVSTAVARRDASLKEQISIHVSGWQPSWTAGSENSSCQREADRLIRRDEVTHDLFALCNGQLNALDRTRNSFPSTEGRPRNLKGAMPQQNTVERENTNQDDKDRHHEGYRPHVPRLGCADLVQKSPVLPGCGHQAQSAHGNKS
jgi:hypothetical protein